MPSLCRLCFMFTALHRLVLSWRMIGRPPHEVSRQWAVVVPYGMRRATGASLSSWFLKAAGLSCSTFVGLGVAAGSNFGLLHWLALSPLQHSRTTVRAVWHGFKKPRFFRFLKKTKKPKKSEFRFLGFLKNKNLMSNLSFFSSSIYHSQIGQVSTLYK